MEKVLLCLTFSFSAFAIGRWSHCYLNVWMDNPKWAPHHWIYGLILIIIGLVYLSSFTGLLGLFFGLGLFISDFNDFFHLRFFTPDPEGEKRFWHID